MGTYRFSCAFNTGTVEEDYNLNHIPKYSTDITLSIHEYIFGRSLELLANHNTQLKSWILYQDDVKVASGQNGVIGWQTFKAGIDQITTSTRSNGRKGLHFLFNRFDPDLHNGIYHLQITNPNTTWESNRLKIDIASNSIKRIIATQTSTDVPSVQMEAEEQNLTYPRIVRLQFKEDGETTWNTLIEQHFDVNKNKYKDVQSTHGRQYNMFVNTDVKRIFLVMPSYSAEYNGHYRFTSEDDDIVIYSNELASILTIPEPVYVRLTKAYESDYVSGSPITVRIRAEHNDDNTRLWDFYRFDEDPLYYHKLVRGNRTTAGAIVSEQILDTDYSIHSISDFGRTLQFEVSFTTATTVNYVYHITSGTGRQTISNKLTITPSFPADGGTGGTDDPFGKERGDETDGFDHVDGFFDEVDATTSDFPTISTECYGTSNLVLRCFHSSSTIERWELSFSPNRDNIPFTGIAGGERIKSSHADVMKTIVEPSDIECESLNLHTTLLRFDTKRDGSFRYTVFTDSETSYYDTFDMNFQTPAYSVDFLEDSSQRGYDHLTLHTITNIPKPKSWKFQKLHTDGEYDTLLEGKLETTGFTIISKKTSHITAQVTDVNNIYFLFPNYQNSSKGTYRLVVTPTTTNVEYSNIFRLNVSKQELPLPPPPPPTSPRPIVDRNTTTSLIATNKYEHRLTDWSWEKYSPTHETYVKLVAGNSRFDDLLPHLPGIQLKMLDNQIEIVFENDSKHNGKYRFTCFDNYLVSSPYEITDFQENTVVEHLIELSAESSTDITLTITLPFHETITSWMWEKQIPSHSNAFLPVIGRNINNVTTNTTNNGNIVSNNVTTNNVTTNNVTTNTTNNVTTNTTNNYVTILPINGNARLKTSMSTMDHNTIQLTIENYCAIEDTGSYRLRWNDDKTSSVYHTSFKRPYLDAIDKTADSVILSCNFEGIELVNWKWQLQQGSENWIDICSWNFTRNIDTITSAVYPNMTGTKGGHDKCYLRINIDDVSFYDDKSFRCVVNENISTCKININQPETPSIELVVPISYTSPDVILNAHCRSGNIKDWTWWRDSGDGFERYIGFNGTELYLPSTNDVVTSQKDDKNVQLQLYNYSHSKYGGFYRFSCYDESLNSYTYDLTNFHKPTIEVITTGLINVETFTNDVTINCEFQTTNLTNWCWEAQDSYGSEWYPLSKWQTNSAIRYFKPNLESLCVDQNKTSIQLKNNSIYDERMFRCTTTSEHNLTISSPRTKLSSSSPAPPTDIDLPPIPSSASDWTFDPYGFTNNLSEQPVVKPTSIDMTVTDLTGYKVFICTLRDNHNDIIKPHQQSKRIWYQVRRLHQVTLLDDNKRTISKENVSNSSEEVVPTESTKYIEYLTQWRIILYVKLDNPDHDWGNYRLTYEDVNSPHKQINYPPDVLTEKIYLTNYQHNDNSIRAFAKVDKTSLWSLDVFRVWYVQRSIDHSQETLSLNGVHSSTVQHEYIDEEAGTIHLIFTGVDNFNENDLLYFQYHTAMSNGVRLQLTSAEANTPYPTTGLDSYEDNVSTDSDKPFSISIKVKLPTDYNHNTHNRMWTFRHNGVSRPLTYIVLNGASIDPDHYEEILHDTELELKVTFNMDYPLRQKGIYTFCYDTKQTWKYHFLVGSLHIQQFKPNQVRVYMETKNWTERGHVLEFIKNGKVVSMTRDDDDPSVSKYTPHPLKKFITIDHTPYPHPIHSTIVAAYESATVFSNTLTSPPPLTVTLYKQVNPGIYDLKIVTFDDEPLNKASLTGWHSLATNKGPLNEPSVYDDTATMAITTTVENQDLVSITRRYSTNSKQILTNLDTTDPFGFHSATIEIDPSQPRIPFILTNNTLDNNIFSYVLEFPTTDPTITNDRDIGIVFKDGIPVSWQGVSDLCHYEHRAKNTIYIQFYKDIPITHPGVYQVKQGYRMLTEGIRIPQFIYPDDTKPLFFIKRFGTDGWKITANISPTIPYTKEDLDKRKWMWLNGRALEQISAGWHDCIEIFNNNEISLVFPNGLPTTRKWDFNFTPDGKDGNMSRHVAHIPSKNFKITRSISKDRLTIDLCATVPGEIRQGGNAFTGTSPKTMMWSHNDQIIAKNNKVMLSEKYHMWTARTNLLYLRIKNFDPERDGGTYHCSYLHSWSSDGIVL